MKLVALKIWQFFSSNTFQIPITFLMSGLLAGAAFAWLMNLSPLENFFLALDRQMPIVRVGRFGWWLTFSLLLVLSLIIGFVVSSQRAGFVQKFRLTAARSLLVCVFVSATMPLLCVPLGNTSPSAIPLIFLGVFSCAMCIVTRSLLLIIMASATTAIFTVVAGIAIHLTFPFALEQGKFVVEFVQWTIIFSALSLDFGLWLQWQAANEKRRNSEQTIEREAKQL